MDRKAIIALSALALVSSCLPTREEEEVVPPQFLTPTANEVLLIDGEYSLSWSAPGFGETLLLLSTDTARTWEAVDTLSGQEVAGGTMIWPVPDVLPTATGCVLRLVDVARGDTITSATFTITGLQIVSPQAGERLKAGQTYTIVWKTYKYADVNIYLSTDGGFDYGNKPREISKNFQPSWQAVPWTVPDTIAPSCELRLNRYQSPDEYFYTGLFSIE
jgi:hypothetical protein